MANEGNKQRYPQAGLGLVSTSEGLKRADGTKVGQMPRGCPACNREEGRSTASCTLDASLPLHSEDKGGEEVAVRVVIDYCPRCGRLYDVRCSAA